MTVVAFDLRSPDHSPPLCVSEPRPRLSWRLQAGRRDVTQSAYRIQIASDPGFGEVALDTGRVASSQSPAVAWPGESLTSRQQCWWRVMVETASEWSEWSPPAGLEAPLFEPADWRAEVVLVGDADAGPSPLLRRRFQVDSVPVRARLHVTGLGLYRVELNGQAVTEELLAPGWTSYDHRLAYRTLDVTDRLRPGDNVLGAELADGWYRGHLTPDRMRNVYGPRLGLLAQLELTMADGQELTVGTDSAWEWTTGPRRSADLYDGEAYDCRLEVPGWSAHLPEADPDHGKGEHWTPVEVGPADDTRAVLARLVPAGPPVSVVEELPVVARWTTSHAVMFDFGQNLVGWPRLLLDGPVGATVTVRHAEVLAPDGSLHTAALRSAKATDTYVLDGAGPDGWSRASPSTASATPRWPRLSPT